MGECRVRWVSEMTQCTLADGQRIIFIIVAPRFD